MKKREDFELNILGQKWSVVFLPVVIDPEDGSPACGLCSFEDLTIYICSEMSEQVTTVTLIHEMFHAYTRRSGIYNGKLSYDMEEIISDQFGKVLAENFDFDF